MQHIDPTIFQEISRYHEGELSAEERRAVERKLESDADYDRHQSYYFTITGAIVNSAREELKEQLKAWHREGIKPEEEAFIDGIIRRDRRRARWRRIFFFGGSLLGIVLLGILAWILISRIIPGPPPPAVEPPVATDEQRPPEEEEILLGASGNFEALSIPFTTLTVENGTITGEQSEQRQILLAPHPLETLEYRFDDNTLTLFAPDPGSIDPATLQWVLLRTGDEEKHYLRWRQIWFRLYPTPEKQPPEVVADRGVLGLLQR